MTVAIEKPEVPHLDAYLQDFARLEAVGAGDAWLRPVREAGMERFRELGFPTTGDEDWRFTSVDPIASRRFVRSTPARVAVTAAQIAPFLFADLAAARLVFVDGHFAPALSAICALPKGVRIGSLREALRSGGDMLQRHLARYAATEHDAFTALNTAFIEDGGFVSVPRGVALETPVHLLFVSTGRDATSASYPRNLIVAEAASQVDVIEDYVALAESEYFTNAVTEFVLGEGAIGSHTMLVRDSTRSFNVSNLRVEQGRDSDFASHSVLLGGAIVRNNVHPVLAGEGCHSLLNGLYVAGGRQHMDTFMRVEHAKPRGASRQFYKGILDGQAHGVFSGRIVVHPGAQKTDAKQTNMNLLLSDSAQVDTKPQLEIYADDVKCTHGATIGQIDNEAIFYLRSRGISQEAARSLLIYAFAGESLGRMKLPAVRAAMEKLVLARLPRGGLLEETL